MKKKIESYQGAAGGWGAVKSVANAVRKQMDIGGTAEFGKNRTLS